MAAVRGSLGIFTFSRCCLSHRGGLRSLHTPVKKCTTKNIVTASRSTYYGQVQICSVLPSPQHGKSLLRMHGSQVLFPNKNLAGLQIIPSRSINSSFWSNPLKKKDIFSNRRSMDKNPVLLMASGTYQRNITVVSKRGKRKTCKAVAKRFFRTGKGKLKRWRAGKNHNMLKKRNKTRKQLRKHTYASKQQLKLLNKMLNGW